MYSYVERKIMIELSDNEDFKKFSYGYTKKDTRRSDENCHAFEIKVYDNLSETWDLKISCHLDRKIGKLDYFYVDYITQYDGEFSGDWDMVIESTYEKLTADFTDFLKEKVIEILDE